MVWLVVILAKDSHDMLLLLGTERAVSFVVQCEDWHQSCLSEEGYNLANSNRSVCVCVNFFLLSLELDASFPSQRETFEKL